MFHLYNKFSSFSLIFILAVIAFSSFYILNNSYPVYAQNITKNDFNIIATADVGCSIRAQENIKNIEKLHPELFLVAGDLSYKKTPECWFNMTKSLDSITKVTIGNHDDYEEEGVIGDNFKKAVLDHYNLNNSYYSFDYKNVHVLVLDTQLELSVDTLEALAITNETGSTDKKQENKNDDKDKKDKTSEKIEPLNERYPIVNLDDFLNQNSIDVKVPKLEKLIKSNAKVPAISVDKNQYRFVLDDLEKTNMNKNIDWIIVLFHKPMYSSISKQFEEYIIRDKYQNIFDKYNVDLVVQGHNHIYSRTFPLSLNPSNITEPIIDKISDNTNNNSFTNPNGTIFLVVGVGGGELHRIVEEPYYIANQYNKGFGFVDLQINDKRLDGTFYDINLNCNLKTTEKKEKEIMDLESCIPTPIDQNKLKVIDHFAIVK